MTSPTPIPAAAIGTEAPTSRGTFRQVAKCVEATNRDADTLRHALLAQWAEDGGMLELVHRLQSLDQSDPDGALGAEGRLTIWCALADPGTGKLIAPDNPALADLSEEFRNRLVDTDRVTQD